ncbi:hypothetical protein [Oscillibacter sp. GMB15532]|uniref:hypothetical protein n=1 Tax=Oscillibacter sp. GMB15532 TaxID=3230022 RepID=UPI0034DF6FAE
MIVIAVVPSCIRLLADQVHAPCGLALAGLQLLFGTIACYKLSKYYANQSISVKRYLFGHVQGKYLCVAGLSHGLTSPEPHKTNWPEQYRSCESIVLQAFWKKVSFGPSMQKWFTEKNAGN